MEDLKGATSIVKEREFQWEKVNKIKTTKNNLSPSSSLHSREEFIPPARNEGLMSVSKRDSLTSIRSSNSQT